MSGEATIRRGVRNARYAAIPNHVFEDARLSMEARWLLSYLLSKPDNWTVVIGDIIRKGNCGRDKARKMIAELVELGYAEREQTRDDGKFSSSVLVIYDEPTVGIHSSISIDVESVASLPQTDLPATAKPSPDSPSPGKSALSNNSDLANTDSYQNERERERGSGNQDENPAAVERAFKKFFLGWKTAISDSEPEARRYWAQLSTGQRTKAESRSSDYQAAALSTGRKHLCSAATYLKEERWEKLPEAGVAAQTTAPEAYTAYSRAGRALLLKELLRPQRYLQLTSLEEMIVRDKPEKRDVIWRDKREKQGWPEAMRLIETTVQRRRFNVPELLVSISQDFDKVKVGGEIWEAWKRLHHTRCWPWLPAPDGLEWMQFPRLSPDIEDIDQACEQAVSDFENALGMERDNDDAA